jgi:beta-barrel assembly-enhancing protease
MLPYVPKLPDDTVNVTQHSHLAELAKLCAGVIGLVIVAYTLFSLTAEWLVMQMAPKDEAFLSLALPLPPSQTSGAMQHTQQHWQTLLNTLTQHYPKPAQIYKVHVLPDPTEANALAMPGGHIVVYSGLLPYANTTHTQAFVLGHELGHFHYRHHLKGIARQWFMGALVATVLGADNRLVGMVTGTLHNTDRVFSQQQELEADAYGMALLQRYYHTSQGAIDFLTHMQTQESKAHVVAPWLTTHPPTPQRLAQAQRFMHPHATPVLPPNRVAQ